MHLARLSTQVDVEEARAVEQTGRSRLAVSHPGASLVQIGSVVLVGMLVRFVSLSLCYSITFTQISYQGCEPGEHKG